MMCKHSGHLHQQVVYVGIRFDMMSFCVGHDTEQDRHAAPGCLAADELPVLAPNSDRSNRTFAQIVVNRKPAIRGVGVQCSPVLASVLDCPGGLRFG